MVEKRLVVVHAANVHDSKGAPCVLSELKFRFSRLVKIIADGDYRGELVENTKKAFGWVLEIVLRKDFEYYTETSQTMILLAMIKPMLNRIKL